MVVVPHFKRAFGYTHVRLFFLVINSFYRCLINNSIGLAFPRQWAGIFVTAVAVVHGGCVGLGFGEQALVVGRYNSSDVWHAAVAEFQCLPAAYFP